MSSINFANAYWLFIALPIAVLVTVPFALAVRRENANGHNITSYALHIVMALIIGFVAAGTSFFSVVTKTEVYVVADVSYSAHRNLDDVDEYIDGLSHNLPRNTAMGVVCFGKDCEVLTQAGGRLKSVKNARVDDSETNISAALAYTGELFGEDTIKRIVLITDGKESDTRGSIELKRTVDELELRGIRVDAIYLDDNIKTASYDASGETVGEYDREVQISSVEYTKHVFLNREARATVYFESSYATNEARTRIALYQGDRLLRERYETLSVGLNGLEFDLVTSEAGTYDYEVRIEDEDDETAFNNVYRFTQSVSQDLRVLLVTSKASDKEAVQSLYGEGTVIDAYVNTKNIPYTVEALSRYDEIVLSEIDLSEYSSCTMFVESLETVVSLYGKSLVAMGDLHIQNRTDEVLKNLEKMLPLDYGNHAEDPKLFTIVIDVSYSLENAGRLLVAKQAAINLVNGLNDGDQVCIMTFAGDAYPPIQTITSVADREAINEKIREITAKQGTALGVGLKAAFEEIRYNNNSEKHVFFISDGLNNADTTIDPLATVQQMRANNIYCSVLDVGRAGNDNMPGEDPVNKSGRELLQNLASNGSGTTANPQGNYYYCSDIGALDSIMPEVQDDISESVISGIQSRVKADSRNDGSLAGIDAENTFVTGFVNSEANSLATTVLTVEYTKERGGTVDVPLYAHWALGAGRVAAFTSSLSGAWTDGWKIRDAFMKNMLSSNVPDEQHGYPFIFEISQEGKYGRAELTLPSNTMQFNPQAVVTVTLPDGGTLTGEMALLASGTAVYDFPLSDTGKYGVSVSVSYNGITEQAEEFLNVSYASEYDAFASYDAATLHKIVGSGEVSEDGHLVIKNDDSIVATFKLDLTVPLLIVLAVMFVADIVVRKIKWNDIKSLFGKGRK